MTRSAGKLTRLVVSTLFTSFLFYVFVLVPLCHAAAEPLYSCYRVTMPLLRPQRSGFGSDVILDSSGDVYISYGEVDPPTNNLTYRLAKCSGTDCSYPTVFTLGNSETYSSSNPITTSLCESANFANKLIAAVAFSSPTPNAKYASTDYSSPTPFGGKV